MLKKRNLHHRVAGQRSRQCLVLWVTGTEENPESITEQRSIILDLRGRVSKKYQAIVSSVVDHVHVQIVFIYIISQNEVAPLLHSLPSFIHCNSDLL
jgi:hypothetical protein